MRSDVAVCKHRAGREINHNNLMAKRTKASEIPTSSTLTRKTATVNASHACCLGLAMGQDPHNAIFTNACHPNTVKS